MISIEDNGLAALLLVQNISSYLLLLPTFLRDIFQIWPIKKHWLSFMWHATGKYYDEETDHIVKLEPLLLRAAWCRKNILYWKKNYICIIRRQTIICIFNWDQITSTYNTWLMNFNIKLAILKIFFFRGCCLWCCNFLSSWNFFLDSECLLVKTTTITAGLNSSQWEIWY